MSFPLALNSNINSCQNELHKGLSMISGITTAFDGYAISTIKLEDFVEVNGYTPVLSNLVDLNGPSGYSQLKSPSSQFIDALSSKSQGILLTSALMADNQILYKALCYAIKPNIQSVYSQDLPAFLGGSYASMAISEMTRRALIDVDDLVSINSGIAQIKSTYTYHGRLTQPKAIINSAQWVERDSLEGEDLMAIVKSAPDDLKVPELKTNALGHFLLTGLQVGIGAAAAAGIGLAALYGSGFVHNAGRVNLVDFDSRMTIESLDASGNADNRKVSRYGEIGSAAQVLFYAERETELGIVDTIESFSSADKKGVVRLVQDSGNPDICVVQTHQVAPVTADGDFYNFGESRVSIYDKNLTDFYLDSHEVSHCFNVYTDNLKQGADQSIYDWAYGVSLNEISSDLGAIIDYMIETGNTDIYTDMMRPQRISNVKDLSHKTAWALDIILKDLDPASIKHKSKVEIPKITRFLMEKHFMGNDGTFSPGKLGSRGTTTVDTPAANALFNEIIAAKNIANNRYPELKSRLKADITDTLSNHYAKYSGVAPQEITDAAMKRYVVLAKTFGLEPIKIVQSPRAKISKRMDSMLSNYL